MVRRRQRVPLVVALVAASLALAGCVQSTSAASLPGDALASAGSDPVIPSEIYAVQVGEVAQASRIAELAEIVEALRSESTGGWQARQSDINGYSAEVSGGTFPGDGDPAQVTRQFMERFGGLFGPATGVTYTSTGFDDLGLAVVTIGQELDGVPVEGARLVVTLRESEGGSVIDGVRGQLVDLSGIPSEPALDEGEAIKAAQSATGATTADQARLAIVDTGRGPALVWLVVAQSGPEGGGILYPALLIIDATDGSLIGARTIEEEFAGFAGVPATDGPGSDATVLGNFSFTFPQGGRPIVIESDYLGLFPISVNAQQLPDGSILMLDATGPGASVRTKEGLIVVIDADQGGYDRRSASLGPVAQYRDVQSIPKDALYALWGARQTVDLLAEDFGIASFDGANSPLPLVINDTQGEPCLDNAFFLTHPGISYASFGVPCPYAGDNPRETMVALEIVAHEIGHGVTYSAGDFAGTNRQTRGLGEGVADYLGMVVRNSVDGGDSTLLVGEQCTGRSGSDPLCSSWRDGEGMRTVSSGATMHDYVYLLDNPFGFSQPGVEPRFFHENGMILTNALTEARRAIAAAAGEQPGSSARARVLDRAVLRAIRVYFTSSTGLVDAAEAVRRAGADVGMTPQELSILSERLRANNLCRGCEVVIAPSGYVIPVAVSTSVKTSPVALGDRVAYILAQGSSQPIAVAATPGQSGGQQIGPAAPLTVTLAGYGTRVLQTQATGRGAFALGDADIATGASRVVTTNVDPYIAPAVGPDAIAWITGEGNLVYQANGAAPQTKALSSLTARIATGNGRVAILAADGELSVWTASTDSTRVIAQLTPGPPGAFRLPDDFPLGALAMSGDRIAVVSAAAGIGSVLVFDMTANTKTTHSTSALPLGIAVSDDFVVWTEFIGLQQTPLASDVEIPDTELRGRNLVNNGLYRMVNHRGVQGFPSLSDGLLVWQESANGSSDIYAARLGTG